jgi:pyruvate dehydrogenase E2 component (dihydrolipoamide acetyltransferase)
MMPTDVTMPQMGESIFEGTITKWLKKPGDTVQRDEPLFEISTDKVDAEIPAPASGYLTEIKIAEGATVQINTVVGVISEAATSSATPAAATSPKAESDGGAASAMSGNAPAGATQPPQAPAVKEAESAQPTAGRASDGIDVTMPQMGESIFEGTITKWLKEVGDPVQRDEPLFEISTDKVDAEIPAPASGILSEIKVPAGATVQINTVVAVIGGSPSAQAPTPAAPKPGTAETNARQPSSAPSQVQPSAGAPKQEATTPASASAGDRVRSSPLVRRIAKDNNLDLRQVSGTGSSGRITKEDVLQFLSQQGSVQAAPVAAKAPAPSLPAGAQPLPISAPPVPKTTAATPSAAAGELVPMTRMRSIIAQRMVDSKRTNAHVHTVFKVDMTRVVKIREKEKAKYEQRNGVKLTYMPFITRAVVATLRKMPIVNASMEGDGIRYHQNVNIGIAVALDWGLIVPVIKQAEEKNFLGIARAIVDLAERARGKKLKPDEVGSGTFTITNPGIFGEQFGTPIINQPESAILGVGGLFKEPVVVTDEYGTDSIAIHSVIRLTLGFDHRIIDGADAGRFMAEVKKYLETWSEDIG